MLAISAVLAVAGGVAWAQATDQPEGGDVIRLDQPGEYVDPTGTNPPQVGERLAAFALTTAAGDAVTLQTDGRPMVVNLWASNCPPCARELPAFAAVDAEYGDRVRIVGVNDFDSAAKMESFAADRGVQYELLMDPDYELQDGLHVVSLPVTLFVTADGEIVGQTGALSESELRAHVEALLA